MFLHRIALLVDGLNKIRGGIFLRGASVKWMSFNGFVFNSIIPYNLWNVNKS